LEEVEQKAEEKEQDNLEEKETKIKLPPLWFSFFPTLIAVSR
jgi:hypothetical protein